MRENSRRKSTSRRLQSLRRAGAGTMLRVPVPRSGLVLRISVYETRTELPHRACLGGHQAFALRPESA